jgi:methyltransferase
VSKRHEASLLARGGSEHAPGQMPWMRALHAGWLVAMLAEVWLLERVFSPTLAAIAFIVFLIGQGLRLLAMSALGERWTVKIITLPREAPVTGGVFRFLRHPNYLGVVLEVAALPLCHGAFITSAAFSLLNGVLLYFRIRAEEASLARESGYLAAFARTPRFVPRKAAGRHGS